MNETIKQNNHVCVTRQDVKDAFEKVMDNLPTGKTGTIFDAVLDEAFGDESVKLKYNADKFNELSRLATEAMNKRYDRRLEIYNELIRRLDGATIFYAPFVQVEIQKLLKEARESV